MTSDLETRLFRDAATRNVEDAPAPSVEEFVTAAFADRARRFRRRVQWLAAAAAAVLVATTAVVIDSSTTPPPIGNPARSVVIPTIVGATVTLENPHELAVAVEVPGTTVPCALRSATVRVVWQRADAVSIDVSGFKLINDPRNCEIAKYLALSLQLNTPLGKRRLIDAATDKSLPVVQGRSAPVPAYLPPGYAPAPMDAAPSDITIIGKDGRTHTVRQAPQYADRYTVGGDVLPPAAVRLYFKGTAPHIGSASLQLVFGRPGPSLPGSRVLTGITLHGHRVRFADLAHQRCLTWLLQARRVARVCSDVAYNPNSGEDYGPLLSQNQLLKVARSIH